MKTRRVSFCVTCLTLVLLLYVGVILAQQEPVTIPPLSAQTLTYHDADYAWSVLHPESWQVFIQHDSPFSESHVIKRSTVFETDLGEVIVVDVWQDAADTTLAAWFNREHAHFLSSEASLTLAAAPNAVIGGVQAIVVSDPNTDSGGIGAQVAVLRTGQYVYRIEYMALRGGANADAFRTLLQSFTLTSYPAEPAFDIDALPLYPQPLTPQIFEPLVASCGGYTDPTDNRFPCCSNGGNCTWWARYKRPDFRYDMRHHARYWFHDAIDYGYPVGLTPRVGAVVVWGMYNATGHVAYVEAVRADGLRFDISQMSCGTYYGSKYTSSISTAYETEFFGFIYKKGEPSDIFPGDVVLGDYNGDGRTDRAQKSHDGLWRIDYARDGFGAWDAAFSGYGGSDAYPVPADYDGDGKTDLSIKTSAGNWLIDYARNGFGSWDATFPEYGGANVYPVPADYDGDGKADLSIMTSAGRWLIDYARNGFGLWDEYFDGYGGANVYPVPADYDGDGKADLSIMTQDGRWLIDYARNGFGSWDDEFDHVGGAGARPAPADYDGDGKTDLSIKTSDGRWLIDYARNGFGAWDDTFYGYGDAYPLPADYDGDGRADLSVRLADGRWLVDYACNGFNGWDEQPCPGMLPPKAQNLDADANYGRPVFSWTADDEALWFRLYIGSADYQTVVLDHWYERSKVCEDTLCSVKPDIHPVGGTYHAWMQSWGTGGYSIGGESAADGWSTVDFMLPSTAPGPIQPLTVTAAPGGDVTFTWQGAEYATWYNVWVGTDGGANPPWQQHFFDWILAENLGCEYAGICTLTHGVALASDTTYNLNLSSGQYVWYVQSWGPGGFSTGGIAAAPGWIKGHNFAVP